MRFAISNEALLFSVTGGTHLQQHVSPATSSAFSTFLGALLHANARTIVAIDNEMSFMGQGLPLAFDVKNAHRALFKRPTAALKNYGAGQSDGQIR